ncbi:bifunctional adenosylcobinamide kinase/adenosylcobinamide-phosphate guanylyltransferase [Shewanella sp. KT0246]|uniref:bifunctional adenosylcobinamide kinase/adenosylcobinamide-phosphate guanylyltransferase n=1 Tax=Shewanella sp. KT0246 TaxID=2815912 RepID=UPI001BC50E5C|nr:bifunctional adenosylcobinamide kinase/adenosylcobinamide-phosphate guanylyltransferase [Shewanella sp. KT0246]GIU48489.1 bifunctional adenosylcobinamide kinase/adenosylcobinamide-phosphate guanylyltransferase [Shewanella sp. KT0246]
MISFYLGGARSGKSGLAEQEVALSQQPAIYIATSRPSASMQPRIRLHKAQRPTSWKTLEIPLDLSRTLADIDKPNQTIIIDCLTLWLTNHLMAQSSLEDEIKQLSTRLAQMQSHCVVVSTECGQSLIPKDALSLKFVAASGEMHQAISHVANKVFFCQSRIAIPVKTSKESHS